MRVAVVVAAMFFCSPVFAQGVKLPSVTNSIGMELIEIPAGKFTMGSPAGEKDRQKNEAQVQVTLTQPFGLGKYEVTQGQWKSVMGTEPWNGQKAVKADKDCPATFVSWDDATAFCEKLTAIKRKSGKLKAGEEYRLPTEAEWEYACRAGSTTAYSFGNDESELGEYGWFNGNADDVDEKYAHKVGLKKPNPWGLYDMHGNVFEWCSDWDDTKLSGGGDPAGPKGGSNRVYRGGSWWRDKRFCRSANRFNHAPSFHSNNLGFRVARSQSETVKVADRRQQGAQAEPAPKVAVVTRPVMEKPKPVVKVSKPGQTITNSIGMELIEIPAGTFTMGSPAGEKDRRENEAQVPVTLTKPFSLGKTEVTQGQWKSVMSTEPWKRQPYTIKGENVAATYVSYDDAADFCERLTKLERNAGKLKAGEEYRLPTEAEWEYACRAGTETAFSFGDDEKQFGEYAWWGGVDFEAALKGEIKAGSGNAAGEQYAHKVGLKKPNAWGLHDMHGNVFEWCSDWYGEKLSGGTDPEGPDGGSIRVFRGGGWGSSNPGDYRSAFRFNIAPSIRSDYLGFRVARAMLYQKQSEFAQGGKLPSVTNSIFMELIEIPAGKFTMGSPADVRLRLQVHRLINDQQPPIDNEAQVSVTLTKPFGLGKTEVTQGQWKSVMSTEPWDGQTNTINGVRVAATCVSYDDAADFCERLTDLERNAGKLKAGEEYRLPTEAEWEYACRAGTTTMFSFEDGTTITRGVGDLTDEKQFGEYAWFGGNAFSAGEQYAHKVDKKMPNPWGLHDMHGNVCEWCSDWYGEKLSGGTDPEGPNGGSARVIRGGGWRNDSGSCRSAFRDRNVPSYRHDYLGFRVARSQSVQ